MKENITLNLKFLDTLYNSNEHLYFNQIQILKIIKNNKIDEGKFLNNYIDLHLQFNQHQEISNLIYLYFLNNKEKIYHQDIKIQNLNISDQLK